MATYVTPKRATAFQCFVELRSQANTKIFQVNPTLAAGDVKISKDGGAFANLTTLPAVAPASGRSVQVDLSATEMTADNVKVVFSDAAGAEWCDLSLLIQTTARQVDDLATPTNITAATGIVLSGVTHTGAVIPTVTTTTTATNLTTNNDKTGYGLSSAAVQAIWDALTTALTTVGSVGKRLADYVTGDAYVRLGAPAGASVSADIAAVKVDTAATYAAIDTEVSAILAAVDTEVSAILALLDDPRGEPGQGAPAVNPDAVTKIDFLYKAFRNKVTQTATTLSIYADDAATVDQKTSVSDDGTTYTRGELSAGP